MRAAKTLVATDPAAIETLDDTIVNLAKKDVIWNQINHFFSDRDDHLVKSVNLIEFFAEDTRELEKKVSLLCEILDQNLGKAHEAISYAIATEEADINALWSLRKKGVGLLGNKPGRRRPIPFVEDTVVPPENLASYIKEFRSVLDDYGLDYGMFGHVDAGCLHVRPALDMRDEQDEKLIREISDRIKNLVLKYGGIVWGEHGKGLRSEYMPEFFGEQLYGELRKVKEVFDPQNKLNPGKIATPASMDNQIIPLDAAPLRGQRDREIPEHLQDKFAASINCNGNGACFNFNTDDLMCPSYKQSRDRIHSPKGRAGLMREWLRRSSEEGYDASKLTNTKGHLKADKEDFSTEVFDAMNGCLSCKACTSLCPIKVNIPELKSNFLHHYYSRYRRPFRDRLIASGEKAHNIFSKVPWLYNTMARLLNFETIFRKLFGLVNSPLLSPKSYEKGLKESSIERLRYRDINSRAGEFKSDTIFILPDSITAFYESEVFVSAVRLFKYLGFRPIVPEFIENGKALHVKGFLTEFQKTAELSAAKLMELQKLGHPILGIDPALTLVFREEYREYVKDYQLEIKLPHEFLVEMLPKMNIQPLEGKAAHLLTHCGEESSLPNSAKQWQKIYSAFGIDLTSIKSGCCGMAGAYGHELQHLSASSEIYSQSWQQKVDDPKIDTILTTGASCRSQVERFSAKKLSHPLEYLCSLFDESKKE